MRVCKYHKSQQSLISIPHSAAIENSYSQSLKIAPLHTTLTIKGSHTHTYIPLVLGILFCLTDILFRLGHYQPSKTGIGGSLNFFVHDFYHWTSVNSLPTFYPAINHYCQATDSQETVYKLRESVQYIQPLPCQLNLPQLVPSYLKSIMGLEDIFQLFFLRLAYTLAYIGSVGEDNVSLTYLALLYTTPARKTFFWTRLVSSGSSQNVLSLCCYAVT